MATWQGSRVWNSKGSSTSGKGHFRQAPVPVAVTKTEAGGKEEGDDELDAEVDMQELSGGDGKEEFERFQASLLCALAATGTAMTTGRLAFNLNAKKKPAVAALFALQEQQCVKRLDGVPPRWELLPGGSAAAEQAAAAGLQEAPARFSYDDGKPKMKAKRGEFDTLKRVVLAHVSTKGQTGCTAGALGYELGACRKAINAALYACEKEGLAWTHGDKVNGEKVRWQANADAGAVTEPLPAVFAYGNTGTVTGKGALSSPVETPHASKRSKTGHVASQAAASTHTALGLGAFEALKMLLRCRLHAKGQVASSSGSLGWELGARRKAVTAALYSCEKEGTVRNVTPGSNPGWISLLDPPPVAATLAMPAEYAYQAGEAEEEDYDVDVSQARPPAERPHVQQKKTTPPAVAHSGMVSVAASANAVSALNEWSQKSRRAVLFNDLGADPEGGGFLCQVTLDGNCFPAVSGPNKKEAKRFAAAEAIVQLGL